MTDRLARAEFAAECREMARVSLPTFRPHLLHMAETWEQLANARRDELEKQGKSDDDGGVLRAD
jgi:hypothetical protein